MMFLLKKQQIVVAIVCLLTNFAHDLGFASSLSPALMQFKWISTNSATGPQSFDWFYKPNWDGGNIPCGDRDVVLGNNAKIELSETIQVGSLSFEGSAEIILGPGSTIEVLSQPPTPPTTPPAPGDWRLATWMSTKAITAASSCGYYNWYDTCQPFAGRWSGGVAPSSCSKAKISASANTCGTVYLDSEAKIESLQLEGANARLVFGLNGKIVFNDVSGDTSCSNTATATTTPPPRSVLFGDKSSYYCDAGTCVQVYYDTTPQKTEIVVLSHITSIIAVKRVTDSGSNGLHDEIYGRDANEIVHKRTGGPNGQWTPLSQSEESALQGSIDSDTTNTYRLPSPIVEKELTDGTLAWHLNGIPLGTGSPAHPQHAGHGPDGHSWGFGSEGMYWKHTHSTSSTSYDQWKLIAAASCNCET
eukprot:Nk52_evm9s219 gene=Nk52_evmTU9s219